MAEAHPSIDVERILRTIPTREKIFRSSRRVYVFPAVDCVKLLSKHGLSSDQIKTEVADLLASYRIIKVREHGTDSVDLQSGRSLALGDIYMWAEEKTNHRRIFTAIGIVLLILLFVMFQMWPIWLKRMVSYLKYPIGGFIAFLFIAAVVRAVVFAFTYFSHPPGLWLLPNLFAECGFFESFVPLYSWGNEDVSK